MALDELIATLEARGAAEAAAILASARAEALELARAARARMAQRREERAKAHEHQWQVRANAAVADARRSAAASVLEARAGAIDRVWRSAGARLSQPSVRERLRAVIGTHVKEALPYLEGHDVIVRCDEDLVAAVRAAMVDAGVSVVVEPDGAAGAGVVVAAADGSVFIDNTLEARLARLRPKLLTELTARLAGAAASSGQGAGDVP